MYRSNDEWSRVHCTIIMVCAIVHSANRLEIALADRCGADNGAAL